MNGFQKVLCMLGMLCIVSSFVAYAVYKKKLCSTKPISTDAAKAPAVLIALLPGLGRDHRYLTQLQTSLAQCNRSFCVVAIDVETREISIEEQAHQTCQQLVRYMQSSHMPIVLIGHSQGGLRAIEVLRLAATYGLPICQVVTIGAPLRGAPVLDLTAPAYRQRLDYIKQKVAYLATTLSPFLSDLDEVSVGQFIQQDVDRMLSFPGIADLQPTSSCLQRIQDTLVNNTTTPVLLMGSSLDPQKGVQQMCDNFFIPDLLYLVKDYLQSGSKGNLPGLTRKDVDTPGQARKKGGAVGGSCTRFLRRHTMGLVKGLLQGVFKSLVHGIQVGYFPAFQEGFIVGFVQGFVNEFINQHKQEVTKLLNLIVAGDIQNSQHDGLVPLYSQLAAGVSGHPGYLQTTYLQFLIHDSYRDKAPSYAQLESQQVVKRVIQELMPCAAR